MNQRKKVKVVAVMYEDNSYDIFHGIQGRYTESHNWRTAGSGSAKITEQWLEHTIRWNAPYPNEQPEEIVSDRPGTPLGVGIF